MAQYFKGDAVEKQFIGSGLPIVTQTSHALDLFLEEGYDSTPFLLMLYDENRIPFSERINRLAFVDFIKEIYNRFPFVGSFDTYLYVLRAIFGSLSEIFFEVPAPGKLRIDINATSSLDFDFAGRYSTGEEFIVTDNLGNILTFRGIAGIETEYELNLLFSEILPIGITPDLNLTFYVRYDFIAWEGANIYDMVDDLGNQIVFSEIGV